MSECLGCQRLEDENAKLVQLTTGQWVCTYCPEWMIECEATWLLEQPLEERRRLLFKIEAERGSKSVENLKKVITRVFEHDRKVLQKDQPAI